ncbi:MAG: hypothetical protein QOK40_1874 [Miltoncostaeaceae bacterium]|nr:hypothetical protein [Miltoncostaeaceae bacterium]
MAAVALGALTLPAAALAPPVRAPHFTCPWSAAVAALCLAYDAQNLADTFQDPRADVRGFVVTVLPANLGPDAGLPAYAVYLRGDLSFAFGSAPVATTAVVFIERSTGRLRAVMGGADELDQVIPGFAATRVHRLPAPPAWPVDCAVRALTASQARFAPRIAKAKGVVRMAGTPARRQRALQLLRRLQAQVGAYTNLVGGRSC